MNKKDTIEYLRKNPDKMLLVKPFYRGIRITDNPTKLETDANELVPAKLATIKRKVVTQDTFIKEYNPESHDVMFDQNIPSITQKLDDGRMIEIEYRRTAVPFQKMITNKQVMHLCGNPMQFTLMNTQPSDKENENFITFKQYWNLRNQDGMRTKMVDAQKRLGIAGLLYYFDHNGCIKSRLLEYPEYVLCPHNDDNGDRVMESVYYQTDDGEYIDSYDDTYLYRYVKRIDATSDSGIIWEAFEPVKHGFSEIPLITKRGDVAWNNVQSLIDVYEVIYNIFLVIQKRHGWGILYVKGKFKSEAQTIAGAVILNDTSPEGNGSADFKTPPTPQGTIDTLDLMEQTIQKGAGTTFILPKDIKMSGDVSGIAVDMTKSSDNETALQGVIDWQNVADKMCRLFKEGLAKELVNKGINDKAVTEFENLYINAKFKVWKPRSDYEYNNMLISLKGAGLISEETGIEKNTESSPDEKMRRANEVEKQREMEMQTIESVSVSENNGTTNTTTTSTEEGA